MAPAPSIPPYVPRTPYLISPTSLPPPLPPPTAAPPRPSTAPPQPSHLAPTLPRIPQLDGSPDVKPAPQSSDTGPAALGTVNPLLLEPLSSLDEDSGDELDLGRIQDVIMCQYERVSHAKNRWKVVLRDGIMQIGGKDYVFSKLTGELQW